MVSYALAIYIHCPSSVRLLGCVTHILIDIVDMALRKLLSKKKGGANLVCLNNDYLLDPNLGPGRIQIYGPGACPGARRAGFVPKGSSGLGEIICGRGDIPGPPGLDIKGCGQLPVANPPTPHDPQVFGNVESPRDRRPIPPMMYLPG